MNHLKFTSNKYIHDNFDHWKYRFVVLDMNGHISSLSEVEYEFMYNWCIDNLGPTISWHVRDWGVIMMYEKDAMLFKLVWC